MIKVNRYRKNKEGRIIRPSQDWFNEAKLATEKAKAEKEAHQVAKSVYAHDTVHAALEELFYDKCAYCETKVAASSDWDVEHFRPKGRVAEAPGHPGYYWLAYKWENLYLSCTHCNQRRKDRPRWSDMTENPAKGKADQFPIEGTRAMSPEDDLFKEQALLLDPCSDNPGHHLDFDANGQIKPQNGSKKGKTTIEVCNLKRRRLSDARKQIIGDTVAWLERIQMLEAKGDAKIVREAKNRMKIALLANYREYAAVARAVINDPVAFGI